LYDARELLLELSHTKRSDIDGCNLGLVSVFESSTLELPGVAFLGDESSAILRSCNKSI
jgi:hypothetical protein